MRSYESLSSIRTFNNCQFSYFDKYINKRQGFKQVYFVFGQMVEKYICDALQLEIDGEEINWDSIKEECLKEYDKYCIDLDQDKVQDKRKNLVPAMETMRDYAFKDLSGRVKSMQSKLDIDVFGQKIIGYLDLEMKDPEVIIDLKTSSSMWPRGKELNEGQTYLYPMYSFSRYPSIQEVWFSYYIVTSSRNPRFEIRTVKVTREMSENYLKLMDNQCQTMDSVLDRYLSNGDPRAFTGNPYSMFCSKKQCPSAEECEKVFGWRIKD